jgi:formylglycine-generating enzyme
LPEAGVRFREVPGLPWWRQVQGADWAHPEGEGSSLTGRDGHPVFRVSWEDAAG